MIETNQLTRASADATSASLPRVFAIARKCAVLALMASVRFGIFAADPEVGFDCGVNRGDPNFVTASLLLASPGDELFSCAGHAAFRLECPTYKLDFCFSYESERAVDRLPVFFAGKLKMGMFAIKTKEFLEEYRKDGRGVRQYRMNLPPPVKQRLWKLMDDKVAEGANLPYDYIKRGCAWSMLRCLFEAVVPEIIEEGPWPEKYREYHRAVIASSLDDYPWTRCIIHAIVGTDPDHDVPNVRKLVIPKDCLDYLKAAKINGIPIIDAGDGEELLPRVAPYRPPLVRPLTVAWFVFALAVLSCLLTWTRLSQTRQKEGASFLLDAMGTHTLARPDGSPPAMFPPSFALRCILASTYVARLYVTLLTGSLLMVQFLAGCFFCYMIGFSNLPATTWNWLVVPFNPFMPVVLGLLLWTRCSASSRGKWISALGWLCVLVLLAWAAFMLFSPHMRTDPAYIVFAVALAVVYVPARTRQARPSRVGMTTGRVALVATGMERAETGRVALVATEMERQE